MKYLQKAGFILIIVGAVLAVYELIYGAGNTAFTKSAGFYIFIVGLVVSGIGQILVQKNKPNSN